MLETGQIALTPGALDALQQAKVSVTSLLNRHVNGDWGELSEEDRKENEFSVKNGFRVF